MFQIFLLRDYYSLHREKQVEGRRTALQSARQVYYASAGKFYILSMSYTSIYCARLSCTYFLGVNVRITAPVTALDAFVARHTTASHGRSGCELQSRFGFKYIVFLSSRQSINMCFRNKLNSVLTPLLLIVTSPNKPLLRLIYSIFFTKKT